LRTAFGRNLLETKMANSKGSDDRNQADKQTGGNRDQQSQSGAIGEPGQGAGSNSTTSVGSSGNYGSGGQQGQRDTGGKQQQEGENSNPRK
jgi:hypothetical protein